MGREVNGVCVFRSEVDGVFVSSAVKLMVCMCVSSAVKLMVCVCLQQ